MARRRLEMEEVLDVAMQIADALNAGHAKGIIPGIIRNVNCLPILALFER
jgi:hypothetical protein